MKIIISLLSARPHQLQKAIDNIFGTSSNTFILVSYSGEKVEFEPSTRLAINYFGLTDPPGQPFCHLQNEGILKAKRIFNGQDGDLVGQWSDDFVADTGWEEALFSAAQLHPEKDYLSINVATNFSAAYIHSFWYHSPMLFCSLSYLRDILNNEFVSTSYAKFFSDSDNSQLAQLLHRYQYVENCVIRHVHHLDGGKRKDELDSKWDKHTQLDYQVYKGRRRLMMETFIPPEFSTLCFNWKQSLLATAVLKTVEKINCKAVVETGTGWGSGSTRFFSKLLPGLPIHSIEAAPFNYIDARELLAGFSNVNLYLGFSLEYQTNEPHFELYNDLNGLAQTYKFNPPTKTCNLLGHIINTVECPFFFLDTPSAEQEYKKILKICGNKKYAILINQNIDCNLPTIYSDENWKIVVNCI